MNQTTTTEKVTITSGPLVRHYRFPGSMNTVHQDGTALTRWRPGVNVVLHLREGSPTPHCAEVYSDDCEEYAELGLSFEHIGDYWTLSDQDGSFSTPLELCRALEMEGFTVPPDYWDEPHRLHAMVRPGSPARRLVEWLNEWLDEGGVRVYFDAQTGERETLLDLIRASAEQFGLEPARRGGSSHASDAREERRQMGFQG